MKWSTTNSGEKLPLTKKKTDISWEKYVWDDFQLCRETFAQYNPILFF